MTDPVNEEVKAWQARPLDATYPIVYLDCIHVKVREGAVRVKAVYLAIGINMNGENEVLGLWVAQTLVTELRNRGLQHIFVACIDGLKGFLDAIEAVFPRVNRPGFRGGCLVSVSPLPWRSDWRVADSSLPQLLLVGCTLLPALLLHHPHCTLTHLGRQLVRLLHGSILSEC